MNKTDYLKSIYACGKMFKEELENTNLLFIYGSSDNPKFFEAEFLARHFLHLTGVTYKNSKEEIRQGAPAYSVEFYNKVISNKLTIDDFEIEDQNVVYKKLNVLPSLIPVYKKAKMVGNYNEMGFELMTNKLVGGIIACMGFVKDDEAKYYSPNTILDKDIRMISEKPQFRLLAVLKKNIDDDKYNILCCLGKGYEFSVDKYPEELKKKINLDYKIPTPQTKTITNNISKSRKPLNLNKYQDKANEHNKELKKNVASLDKKTQHKESNHKPGSDDPGDR